MLILRFSSKTIRKLAELLEIRSPDRILWVSAVPFVVHLNNLQHLTAFEVQTSVLGSEIRETAPLVNFAAIVAIHQKSSIFDLSAVIVGLVEINAVVAEIRECREG